MLPSPRVSENVTLKEHTQRSSLGNCDLPQAAPFSILEPSLPSSILLGRIDEPADGNNAGTSRCTACNKTFKTRQGLNRHIGRVHREPVSFHCPCCGNLFQSMAALNAHTRRVHCDSLLNIG